MDELPKADAQSESEEEKMQLVLIQFFFQTVLADDTFRRCFQTMLSDTVLTDAAYSLNNPKAIRRFSFTRVLRSEEKAQEKIENKICG